jgi:peptidoglycan hydrolase-like protein with peptidoglycan-binding domain
VAVCTVVGVIPLIAHAASAGTEPQVTSWTAVFTTDSADNVAAGANGWRISDTRRTALRPGLPAQAIATVLSTPHPTGKAVAAVRADVDATVPGQAVVEAEVRGQRADGGWTEWRATSPGASTPLPAAVTSVQVRLTLTAPAGGASPVLRAVRLTATGAGTAGLVAPQAAQKSALAAAALTYRVFATREGLVGGTTSNGHVIVANDHFVALPSRRGLSPKNTTTYSVRVCNPANGRCLSAPVWDVGPWNTKDDYWNPPSQRQMWTDLPQGRPEAQAAYQNGYNGGKDEFGRKVANPAGIDLADGVFRDLGMTDNGFVNVTYLWTGASTASFPTIKRGAAGSTVRALQYLLNYRGVSLTVDGSFGANTETAVRSFQSSHGLTVDGVVGPQTWSALVVTLSKGANNAAVKAVQTMLNAHGASLAVDGDFGSGTDAAVRSFQSAQQITVDGVVGSQTWQHLLS